MQKVNASHHLPTAELLAFFLAIFLAFPLALVPRATVRADVLLELDDSFYQKHHSECDYFYRSYTVNAPAGYAVVWKSPLSDRQNTTIANGEAIYGNWHYTDENGEVWCSVQTGTFSNAGEQVLGWIRTSDCFPSPDYISFREAYGNEFVSCDESYDDAFRDVESIVLWKYPGSNVIAADGMDTQMLQDTPASQLFDLCWKDPCGRMWGYLGYYYGIRNTWVCLDDPAAVEIDMGGARILPQDTVIYPAKTPGGGNDNPSEDEFSGRDNPTEPGNDTPPTDGDLSALAVGGVAAVVAVTLGLLWAFFIRKKPERAESSSK